MGQIDQLNLPEVFIAADNIFSPIARTTSQNFEQVKNGVSAIKQHQRSAISEVTLAAALFNEDEVFLTGGHTYTKFEQLIIASVSDALSRTDIKVSDPDTGLIVSSTKGNITLLETEKNDQQLQKRISLTTSAKLVADHFGFVSQPLIISNACISGVMALISGMRLIQSGRYKNIVVTGADVISRFVVSGFQSFQALSQEVCKPFDRERVGLNLGEGAATAILSSDRKYKGKIRITGGGISNDANHISGPSRTGIELADAISKAIKSAGLTTKDIDLISAHGTATAYNDDMEANALTLTNLYNTPVNGVKGIFGHTLGAAGLFEAILTAKSMELGIALPTLGFEIMGTKPLNIVKSTSSMEITHSLKTASGFGGCNAAMVLSK